MGAKKDHVVAESTTFVTRLFEKKGTGESRESSEQEQIQVHRFVTEPARVSVEYGLTINLGNFEFARVAVTCSVPCYIEELEEAHKFASDWATKKIQAEKAEIDQRGSKPVF